MFLAPLDSFPFRVDLCWSEEREGSGEGLQMAEGYRARRRVAQANRLLEGDERELAQIRRRLANKLVILPQ